MKEFGSVALWSVGIVSFVIAGTLHYVNRSPAEPPVQRESAYVERVLALHDRIMEDSYTKDTAAMLEQARLQAIPRILGSKRMTFIEFIRPVIETSLLLCATLTCIVVGVSFVYDLVDRWRTRDRS